MECTHYYIPCLVLPTMVNFNRIRAVCTPYYILCLVPTMVKFNGILVCAQYYIYVLGQGFL